jgi:hypothetical protein
LSRHLRGAGILIDEQLIEDELRMGFENRTKARKHLEHRLRCLTAVDEIEYEERKSGEGSKHVEHLNSRRL